MNCAVCGNNEAMLDEEWLTARGVMPPPPEWAVHERGPEWTHDPLACAVCKDTGEYWVQDAEDDAHMEPCHWCKRGELFATGTPLVTVSDR